MTCLSDCPASRTIEYDKFQTYVLRNTDGRLESVAFQNTEMSKRAKNIYGERVTVG